MKAKNVGGKQRLMRAGMALGLFALARRANRSNHRAIAELASVGAASLLFNTVTGYCMFNGLLGKDTTAGRKPMPPSDQAPTVPETRP